MVWRAGPTTAKSAADEGAGTIIAPTAKSPATKVDLIGFDIGSPGDDEIDQIREKRPLSLNARYARLRSLAIGLSYRRLHNIAV